MVWGAYRTASSDISQRTNILSGKYISRTQPVMVRKNVDKLFLAFLLWGSKYHEEHIKPLFRYCGILAEVEPCGVFADLVPQQPLNRNKAFRAALTIIPDIQAELPDDSGEGTRRTYIEVKTVSSLSQ